MNEKDLKALLTPAEAAEFIGGLREQTLATWRMQKRGPRFLKVGSKVRYRKSDLDDWLEAQAVATK